MIPLNEIIYGFALPSWAPERVTPFQGFAPGLIELVPLVGYLPHLPADIVELGMAPADRLARRRAGWGDWWWSPINIETLTARRSPTPFQPFMVIFTADREVARRVSRWRRDLRIRPLHISLVPGLGAIHPSDMTVERLQQHCAAALRQAKAANRRLETEDARASIDAWQPFEKRPNSLRYHTHNVTAPNEMVLVSTGEERPANEAGHLNASAHEEYVLGALESAQAVRTLQNDLEYRPVFRIDPPRPDLILTAPSMHIRAGLSLRAEAPRSLKRAMRALDRQKGYTLQIPMAEEDISVFGPMLALRGAELKTQTVAVGMRAASTFASTLRLPASVNRTAGVVATLARYLREHDDRPSDIKTARVFRIVQDALRDSIPAEHLTFIAGATSGVKIVADAPLEWIPIDGLPLCLHTDVSRVGTTPGNFLVEQLRAVPPIHIPPTAFRHYLVVSMFDDGDGIAHHVRQGLETLTDKEGIELAGTVATPRNVEEFVGALAAYDGPILIVDSHGTHPEGTNIGGLIIGGQPIDIWTLKDRIKVPPIVILSACDTHPYDRSHATVANGFLACGALAVLGTALPIRSIPAALFLVRLLVRAVSFGDIMNGRGQSVPWTNIVGGALRMQLASDIVRGLVQRGMLPSVRARDIQLSANLDLNPHRADWVERLAARCQEVGGFDEARWKVAFDGILSASDVIRYVHLGNPEAILLSDERVSRHAAAEVYPDQSTPVSGS